VVVGILIALQVNQWEQGRENRKQESYYLARLTTELKSNRKISDELRAFRSFQNYNARLILKFYNNELPKDSVDQGFFLALEHLSWLYRHNFEKDVWEELKSTGNIELISDRELRTDLAHLYNTMGFYGNFEDEWATFNMGYRRLLGNADLFDFNTRYELTKTLRPSDASGKIKNLPDFDRTIIRLRSLEGLEGYLTDIVLSSETGAKMYSGLVTDIDSLLLELENIDMN
jgi:hypothetical protein